MSAALPRRSSLAASSVLLFVVCALAACSDANDDDSGDTGAQAGKSGSGGASSTGGGKASGGTSSNDAGKSSVAGASGGKTSPPVTTDFPDAQVYVDAHNQVRAAVQKPASYSGTWAAVPPVTWSDEVAATAQQWANNLKDTMNCGLMHASNSGYGENLAAGTNVDAARAVDMWSSEVENYTYSPKYEFENDTGHYTQIVWRKTTQIGCASAKCSGSTVVVCRYSPPGNYLGQQPF